MIWGPCAVLPTHLMIGFGVYGKLWPVPVPSLHSVILVSAQSLKTIEISQALRAEADQGDAQAAA